MLKPLSDDEYREAGKRATRSLDVCPTCDGRKRIIKGAGIEEWKSDGYRYRGQHHECDCKTQIQLYARYLLANIGDQYMRLDWNDFDGSPEASKYVDDYITNWRSYLMHGFGMTFASPTQGTGKTFAATTVGKALIKANQKVYFQDFVQMVDAFMGEERREVERRMKESTLLILDDVLTGISERQRDLYALKFEVVIRHRSNYNLPTIFTTNLTEEGFEREFPRIYSLIAPKQMWVVLDGNDYRKKQSIAEETAVMVKENERRPIT